MFSVSLCSGPIKAWHLSVSLVTSHLRIQFNSAGSSGKVATWSRENTSYLWWGPTPSEVLWGLAINNKISCSMEFLQAVILLIDCGLVQAESTVTWPTSCPDCTCNCLYHPIGESHGQILTFHWLRAKIDSVLLPCSKPEGDTRSCDALL